MDPVDKESLLPRFHQVKQSLRRLIAARELQPGEKLPGERELARRFEVSQMTVNRALGELEREGLLRREIGRGTFVREQETVAGLDRSVVLVFPRPVNLEVSYYHGVLFQGIRACASAAGRHHFSLVEAVEQDLTVLPRRMPGAGLLLFNPTEAHREMLLRLHERHAPCVVVGGSWPDAGIPSVDSDNVAGARQAVEHLIAQGHRRIAVVNGDLATPNSRDRFAGYRQVVRENDLPVRQEWVIPAGDAAMRPAIARRLRDILDRRPRPTAVFATGYYLAAETMQIAKQAGLRVPEDLSVVGFDDPPSAVYLDPPLTTVEQPLFEMGECALAKLTAMFEGRSPEPEREILPVELVVRGSTAPPAGASM